MLSPKDDLVLGFAGKGVDLGNMRKGMRGEEMVRVGVGGSLLHRNRCSFLLLVPSCNCSLFLGFRRPCNSKCTGYYIPVFYTSV